MRNVASGWFYSEKTEDAYKIRRGVFRKVVTRLAVRWKDYTKTGHMEHLCGGMNLPELIIRFVIPLVFNKLIKVKGMFLSNTKNKLC